MKKRLFTLCAIAMMSLCMMACGGGDDSKAAAPAATTSATEAATEAQAADAGEEMCSDETFSALQDAYAGLVDLHNQVLEIYSADEIAGDKDLEEAINASADAINAMGELKQEEISNNDATALAESMIELAKALEAAGNEMLDSAAAATAASDACSDATFATLQENYKVLTETYNVVVDAYNGDSVKQNDEIEAYLNDAKSLIEQLGEVKQDEIAEKDANEVNDAILAILDYLGAIVDQM